MPVAIDKPNKYFEAKTYTGNGGTQSITGLNFKPDLVWIKNRSAAEDHFWYDAVRGISKLIKSNLASAEATTSTTDLFNSFNTDGFTIGNSSGINGNGNLLVSWNFLGANTTVSNTSGSITSTVSANTTSGFSIVSYTGTGTTAQTVGHGLGVAPSMIIIKNRSAVTDWRVYHKSLGVNGSYPNFLELDLTTASNTGDSGNFASVPTSSLFGVGNYNVVNGNGNSMIAYCFAEVKGYSKFGSYTGNGSTDGTFVYTGFKPAFVFMKKTSAIGQWYIWDNKRNTYNVINTAIHPNTNDTDQDYATEGIDMLSNGFKLRSIYTYLNASSATYIYMAFAENPFVSSKGLPCTAR
jgi:hypothetical protein